MTGGSTIYKLRALPNVKLPEQLLGGYWNNSEARESN